MLEVTLRRVITAYMNLVQIIPGLFVPPLLASKLFRSNPTLQVPPFWMILQKFSNSDYFNDLPGWDTVYRDCILKTPTNFMRASTAPDGAKLRAAKWIKTTQLR